MLFTCKRPLGAGGGGLSLSDHVKTHAVNHYTISPSHNSSHYRKWAHFTSLSTPNGLSCNFSALEHLVLHSLPIWWIYTIYTWICRRQNVGHTTEVASVFLVHCNSLIHLTSPKGEVGSSGSEVEKNRHEKVDECTVGSYVSRKVHQEFINNYGSTERVTVHSLGQERA